MLVSQIIRNKPHEGVVTISPGTSLADAAKMLADKRIGAVVVSVDGKSVAGILSERDIVRELAKRGEACLTESVDNVMTRSVFGCSLEDSTDLVLQTMTQKRFRHLPVMKGDEMIGLISIGDVVAAKLSELQLEKDALTGMIMGY
ncbi:CBS domain-containing protein [Roseinatronobacter bogoriensis]|uniref:CBS domain-containing protein n=1 Tax=Roseinatronobacter bogoriensis subsp. barguzinensis TaxID=441209 RepID=A0A2K8KEV7_9RHOB|nr:MULTISPECIES: CBS domain-containing protein [Rhodobaca]ATX66473.1 CBS domain-containing protein [Rhodobaca barguzinensis]MBB4207622.1 CBS domain-containing protein [Rhodobaca bogoriensis DSM 18756]TDW40071.1 CBS domain protein [Rhodobaca barguzinensis]TDY70776.1 CBS domain protein [Rhodobaca bogoriensis DSM 18756]